MTEWELASALIYYVFLALGSISVGYFLIRFAYPEVRVFSPEEKLGASALAGLLVALLALGADILFSGLEAVLAGRGQPLWFWMGASASLFVVLKVAIHEKHGEVAVPVTKKLETIQTEITHMEEKPPESQSEITRKLNELRKKGLIPKSEDHSGLVQSILPSAPKAATPPLAAAKPTPAPSVPQNVQEAKRVLEKARETEIEAILTDLNLKQEQTASTGQNPPPESAKTTQAPVPSPSRGYLRHVRPPEVGQTKPATPLVTEQPVFPAKAPEPGTPLAHPRRLYLQKGQHIPTAHEEAKVRQAEAKLEEHRKPIERKAAAGPGAAAAAKPVTMEDLFGPTPQQSTVSQSAPVALVPSAQAPQHCPNCQAKNSRIVFCPYCGTGFCANCSPAITPTAEGFTYQCPKCGEQIPVKRRPATAG